MAPPLPFQIEPLPATFGAVVTGVRVRWRGPRARRSWRGWGGRLPAAARVDHARAPRDAVVWDNRCLLHRAMPWEMREPRVMYHSRIAGDVVTEGV